MTYAQHRPDAATQRAVLGVARAILAGDPEAAVAATATAPCSVCLAISAVQFGFAVATSVAGEEFVTDELHRRFTVAIAAAEAELRAAPN